ncbi:hypothetical protein CRG98_046312 [Punica granatum]|uniref:Uncharacterized protein n=1 Tax=Punica granatum TaxID=22663 RepID=A0A2I0HNM7_PUNGR|nr:hypothetical protein CRG98_046312 [Punica granatum]
MWSLVGARIARFWIVRLESIHLPVGTLESVISCLRIRGKSRGSVRESGDSVERLEECSGARACTFGELGARGVQLECTGGARLCAGTLLCARLDARARWSVRLRVHCSPESTSFTRNDGIDLKS